MKNDEKCKQWVHFWGKTARRNWMTDWTLEEKHVLFICETEWTKKKSFESRFRLKCIFCTLWDSPHLFIAGFENNRHKRIRIPPWLKRMSFLSFTFLPKNKLFSSFPGTQLYKAMCRLTVNAAVYFFFSVSLSSFLSYILLMMLLLCVDCNAGHWFYWNYVLILFSKKHNY